MSVKWALIWVPLLLGCEGKPADSAFTGLDFVPEADADADADADEETDPHLDPDVDYSSYESISGTTFFETLDESCSLGRMNAPYFQ